MSTAQRLFGRTVLSKAAFHRKADAVALLETRRWRGAMYIGGYAIECKIRRRLNGDAERISLLLAYSPDELK